MRTQKNLIRKLKDISYWRETEGRAAVEAWRASGLSMAAFAAAYGLSAQRIRWWRDGLRAEIGALLPVDIVPSAPAPVARATDMMEVVLDGGRRVRVTPQFDESALARLVHVLEGAC